MPKIAVVGAGYWGPNLIRNFANQRDCSELWVCDLDERRLAWVEQRFPRAKLTKRYEDVLASDVDGVVVATPVETHFQLASQAFDAKKHVLVEKPLATSYEHALSLVEQAEHAGRVLMVGHTLEYAPAAIKIRDLIQSGELGRISFISMTRVNLRIHQRSVSVLWDLAPHDLSLLFMWLGERPSTVAAMGKDVVKPGICDVAFLTTEFSSGVIARIDVSLLAPAKQRRISVVGDRKMVVFSDSEVSEQLKIFDHGGDLRDPENFGEFQLAYRTGDVHSPRIEQYEPMAAETAEFLRCVVDGKRPRTDGRNGLRVVEALVAAQHSMMEGGAPVRL